MGRGLDSCPVRHPSRRSPLIVFASVLINHTYLMPTNTFAGNLLSFQSDFWGCFSLHGHRVSSIAVYLLSSKWTSLAPKAASFLVGINANMKDAGKHLPRYACEYFFLDNQRRDMRRAIDLHRCFETVNRAPLTPNLHCRPDPTLDIP